MSSLSIRRSKKAWPRLSTFIRHNRDFEAFAVLPLEPDSWSWSGSVVPVFQAEVDFLESLLPMLNSVELLRHKQRVEHIIQSLRDDIEREKRRDFMGDD